MPLAVLSVRVTVDRIVHVRHVHLGRLVGEGTKRHRTVLLVERVVLDVDLAHRLEDTCKTAPLVIEYEGLICDTKPHNYAPSILTMPSFSLDQRRVGQNATSWSVGMERNFAKKITLRMI